MFDDNRRKYPRANYPCYLTLWLANGSNETIMANTANIGAGGLAVYYHQGIDVGTKLDVQLNFTDQTTPFRCKGVVVRSHKEKDRTYNIGVQFEPLSEIKFAFLDGKISEIMESEKKVKG